MAMIVAAIAMVTLLVVVYFTSDRSGTMPQPYKTILNFKGRGTAKSPVFFMSGRKAYIVFRKRCGDFACYVRPVKYSLSYADASPVATGETLNRSKSNDFSRDSGQHYVQVYSPDCNWELEVWEQEADRP